MRFIALSDAHIYSSGLGRPKKGRGGEGIEWERRGEGGGRRREREREK